MTTEEFVSSFHSLEGVTIGERRKNLFCLLNRTKQGGISELDFSCIQPKNHLEEKFKVETLIYFKRIPELVELLKCENPILIDKILKVKWFLGEAFKNIGDKQLVNEILQYVSFKTKEKMINKFSVYLKDPQVADNFYRAIENRYGQYLASKLLPSCSLHLILRRVKSKRIKLTPRQLQIIINRYPEAIEEILEILNHNCVMEDYKKIFIQLAKRNIPLFLKLKKHYSLSLHLGWRITDKFIRSEKQNIIKDPYMYYRFLHNKQIVKSLHQDMEMLLFSLLKKTVEDDDLFAQVLSIVEKLPAKMRISDLFLLTFEKAYGSPLWKHPSFILPRLLDILNAEQQQNVMKINYNSSMIISEEEWYSYLKTEKSLPVLKRKYHVTSGNHKKLELARLLIKTCKINADREALADVCRHMLNRHDKDDRYVVRYFLQNLQENFKLALLDEQHWISINELLKTVEHRFTFSPFYEAISFQEAYIHYRLMHNLPVGEELRKWLECNQNFNIIKDNPVFEKHCLLALGELVPSTIDESKKSCLKINFLLGLINWNQRHPEDPLSVFYYMDTESIKELLSKANYYQREPLIMYFTRLKTNPKERAQLLKLYFLNCDIQMKAVNWLIKHEPSIIADNIESITRSLLKQDVISRKHYKSSFFWMYCNNYSHLEIPSQIRNIYSRIAQEEPDKQSLIFRNVIIASSYLMPADEFLQIIVSYYPTDLQADPKTKEGRKIYEFQGVICNCLKNVIPPSQMLEIALIFCKGDYLKLILRSLYSLSNNINENKLAVFFNELAERAVSVRKHAIHLTFRVLDKRQIANVLEHFMKTDKNVSIRKFIFKCSFNYFTSNPNAYFWELVKTNISAVDDDDEEAFDMLMQVEKIPSEYLGKYVVFLWEYLEKLSNQKYDRVKFLNCITSETINLLPKEFCETVIREYFLKGEDCLTTLQSNVQSFTCKYIIYCESETEQDERLNSVFAIFKNYIITKWNVSEIRHEARNCSSNFIKEFCLQFLRNKCSDRTIFLKFVNIWNGFLKPHDAFDEYLHLQFTLIFMEKLPITGSTQKLVEMCNSLSITYGPTIIGIFCDKLQFFTAFFFDKVDSETKEQELYALIKNLVNPDSSGACLLLAILLLNNNPPSLKQTKAEYETIVGILEKKQEPIIQLYLQNHFSGIEGLHYQYS